MPPRVTVTEHGKGTRGRIARHPDKDEGIREEQEKEKRFIRKDNSDRRTIEGANFAKNIF